MSEGNGKGSGRLPPRTRRIVSHPLLFLYSTRKHYIGDPIVSSTYIFPHLPGHSHFHLTKTPPLALLRQRRRYPSCLENPGGPCLAQHQEHIDNNNIDNSTFLQPKQKPTNLPRPGRKRGSRSKPPRRTKQHLRCQGTAIAPGRAWWRHPFRAGPARCCDGTALHFVGRGSRESRRTECQTGTTAGSWNPFREA